MYPSPVRVEPNDSQPWTCIAVQGSSDIQGSKDLKAVGSSGVIKPCRGSGAGCDPWQERMLNPEARQS